MFVCFSFSLFVLWNKKEATADEEVEFEDEEEQMQNENGGQEGELMQNQSWTNHSTYIISDNLRLTINIVSIVVRFCWVYLYLCVSLSISSYNTQRHSTTPTIKTTKKKMYDNHFEKMINNKFCRKRNSHNCYQLWKPINRSLFCFGE